MMYSGLNPVNASDIQNTFSQSGLLVKYDASGIAVTASVTDAPFAVTIDESSRDAAQALEAAGTGTVGIVGLSGVQYIRCMAITGIKQGLKLYTSQTADNDGYVDDSSANSAVLVGVYMGEDGIDIATGDLVPVLCATIQ
ncbi:MAG: hypothetical protein VW270_16325 [Candidatus Poseidoniales archaeon]